MEVFQDVMTKHMVFMGLVLTLTAQPLRKTRRSRNKEEEKKAGGSGPSMGGGSKRKEDRQAPPKEATSISSPLAFQPRGLSAAPCQPHSLRRCRALQGVGWGLTAEPSCPPCGSHCLHPMLSMLCLASRICTLLSLAPHVSSKEIDSKRLIFSKNMSLSYTPASCPVCTGKRPLLSPLGSVFGVVHGGADEMTEFSSQPLLLNL